MEFEQLLELLINVWSQVDLVWDDLLDRYGDVITHGPEHDVRNILNGDSETTSNVLDRRVRVQAAVCPVKHRFCDWVMHRKFEMARNAYNRWIFNF